MDMGIALLLRLMLDLCCAQSWDTRTFCVPLWSPLLLRLREANRARGAEVMGGRVQGMLWQYHHPRVWTHHMMEHYPVVLLLMLMLMLAGVK